MATLFEAIRDTDISLHKFQACISEYWRKQRTGSGMTGAQAVAALGLDAGQITDINTIQVAFSTTSDKNRFLQIMFDYLFLAWEGEAAYQDEIAFWAMITSEGAQ